MNKNFDHISLTDAHIQKLRDKFGLPIYVYDADRITQQYKKLSHAYSGVDLQINYACKALTNINILKHLKNLGAGLDCVSIQEVLLGLKAGFPASKIYFTPSGVEFEEIVEAVELGVKINLDNLSSLKKFGEKYGNSYPLCLRFNPHIMGGGNLKISTGHINSKFGISIDLLAEVKQVVSSENVRVEGVHMHTGSDILNIETFLESTRALLKVAAAFSQLKYIDFGSGFKVAYSPTDETTNIEELGQKVTSLFNEFADSYGQNLKLIIEPGKFLVSESGYFLTQVTHLKSTPTKTFAGVNSGLNHFIRPMFYDAYHHITNLSNPEGEMKKYTVVGYICETDTFADDREIKEIREGDILCFHNAGAYGFEMSSNYNSRLRPAEALLKNDELQLIRKRETFEDLLRNQIVIE